MSENLELGSVGEDIAVIFLKKKGYSILETNWRYKHKEIDIIAAWRNTLVIVEVKTRSTIDLDHPEDIVTEKKQKFLINAAEKYVFMKKFDMEVRFDIIFIIKNFDNYSIEHIEDAFQPWI